MKPKSYQNLVEFLNDFRYFEENDNDTYFLEKMKNKIDNSDDKIQKEITEYTARLSYYNYGSSERESSPAEFEAICSLHKLYPGTVLIYKSKDDPYFGDM